MLNTIKKTIYTFFYKGVIISLVLGFLIQTIAAFPLYAFVVNEDEIEHVELNNTNEVNEEDIRLLYEIEEYRNEHSKVFKRTDGKLEYVYYDEVVNYFDGKKYIEVDASFKENGSDYDSVINKYSVKLPKKITDNKKIKLSFDDSSIELIYLDVSKTNATIIDSYDTDKKLSSLKNIKGEVLYKGIYKNVDLKIESTGSYFKENVILNKYIENFSFEYTLKLKNLKLIEEDNIIKFIDDNSNVLYTIDPYFMIDSNSNMSYNIKIDYSMVKKDEYRFTIIPNDDFLKNANYPVIIDPVLKYESTSSSNSIIRTKSFMKNSYTSINEKMQITKYVIESEYYTSNDGFYGLMEIDFTNFSDIYNVESATVFLRGHSSSYTDQVVVREIWSPKSTLYFDNINGYTEYQYKYSTLNFKHYDGYYYGLDITRYFNDVMTSKPILFEFSPELFSGNEVTQYFNSNMSSSYKPYLKITLSDSSGLSPYRTYETLSFGDAGTYYVDNLYGYGIFNSSIYSDSNLSFNYFYSSLDNYNNFGYGNGIRLSVFETIEELTYSNNTYLSLTDATGYKEYFYYDDELCCYLSEDGSSGYIHGPNLGDDYNYVYVSENVNKYFNHSNKLVKILYKNQSNTSSDDISVYVEYNTNNLVDLIQQGNSVIKFTYKYINNKYILDFAKIETVLLSEFNDSLGTIKCLHSFKFTYDTNNNLVDISTYSGDIIENPEEAYFENRIYYKYGSDNYLTRALKSEDSFNYLENPSYYQGMQVIYSNGKIVSYGLKLLNDNAYKQLMYIDYRTNNTLYEDFTGFTKTYVFDYLGHTISTYDSEGYAVYYDYANFNDELSKNKPNYILKHQITYVSDSLNVLINPILNSSFEIF